MSMNCDILTHTLLFSNLKEFESLMSINKENFHYIKCLPEEAELSKHKQKLIKRNEIINRVGLMEVEQLRRIMVTRFKHLPHTAKTLKKDKLIEIVIRILENKV